LSSPSPRFPEPSALGDEHLLDGFASGVSALDRWLLEYARISQAARTGRTFVVVDRQQSSRVVAFYSLAAGQVQRSDAAPRVAKGAAKHPVPVVVLTRLAVDESVQGIGLGSWVLRDSLLRAKASAEQVGIRAVVIHASSSRARAFYESRGFDPSASDPLNLQLLLKDIR
jgi:GNAT superfamily N-acetyltransferase